MSIEPDYYQNNGKDLLDRFEEGLLTKDEVRGFYKGNIIKYTVRYKDKNGIEDLNKIQTYIERLAQFEEEVIKRESAKNFIEDVPVGTYSIDEDKKVTTPCSFQFYNPKKYNERNTKMNLDQSKNNYHFFE